MTQSTPPPSPFYKGPEPRTPAALKLLAIPAVIAVLAFGTWFLGAVVAEDMHVAMVLTAAFFGLAFVAGLLLVRARRDLLLPVLGTFVVASLAIGGWLTAGSLFDKTVDEDVITGAPASAAQGGGGGDGAAGGNVQVASGTFTGLSHPAEGTAAVVETADGKRVLTLTNFETDPGPDLRVYLSSDDDASEFEDLGGLKGNKGDQQYEIPEGVDIERLGTVLVWCRAFSVGFGAAALEGS